MHKRKCRVVAFIDGQNVQNDFRRAFLYPQVASHLGAFHPRALAELLVGRGPDFEDWTLGEVRVYVGSPVHSREPEWAAAHDRRMRAWEATGVIPRPRPLLYPEDWPTQRARQKGVDVELAVDVIRMAMGDKGDKFEIGIVLSTDTDLMPAIEAVYRLRGANAVPRICVVRYGDLPKRLNFSGRANLGGLHCFQITREDYEAVRDLTDYRIEAPTA